MKFQSFFLLAIAIISISLANCSRGKQTTLKSSNSHIDSIIQSLVVESNFISETHQDHEQALIILKPILSHSDFQQAHDSSRANAFNKIGCYFQRTKQFKLAEIHLDSAINIQKNKSSKSEIIALANYYFNRSVNHKSQKNFSEALLLSLIHI